MKKLLGILALLLWAGAGAFAQGAGYSELLQKAKDYEAKKEYAYALGYYYDAIEASPDDCQEAFQRWKTLADKIESGKPGLEKYNPFSLHDAWISLLKNAEKYWSEFPLMGIRIDNLEQGELDYKTRTASYTARVSSYRTAKAFEIMTVIKGGLKKAYVPDWTEIPVEIEPSWDNRTEKRKILWPERSIFSIEDGTPQQIYQMHKVATYIEYGYHKNIAENPSYSIKKIYDRDSMSYKYLHGQNIRFAVYDKKGKKLIESDSYVLGSGKRGEESQYGLDSRYSYSVYKFTGVRPDVMEIIDSGEYEIRLTDYCLKYEAHGYDEKAEKEVANFSEIRMPLERTELYTKDGGRKYCGPVYNNLMVKVNDSFEISKYELTWAFYDALRDYESDYIGYSNRSDVKLIEGENIRRTPRENSYYWFFCNELTRQTMGEEHCVYEMNDRSEVIADFSKKGYRLPTKEEWELAARGGEPYKYAGSDNIDELAWYKDNSGETLHEVGLKKPNALGLYDMCGNGGETCYDLDLQELHKTVGRGGSSMDNAEDCAIASTDGGGRGLPLCVP